MGQSVLRDRRTPFLMRVLCVVALFDYNKLTHPQLSKGKRVNIPVPGRGDWCSGAERGNANEPGDVGGSRGKSSLFFVRSKLP